MDQVQGTPIAHQDEKLAVLDLPANNNEAQSEPGPEFDSGLRCERDNEHDKDGACLDPLPMDQPPFHDADLSVAQAPLQRASQPKPVSSNSSAVNQTPHYDRPASDTETNPLHPSHSEPSFPTSSSSSSSPLLPELTDIGSSFVTHRRRHRPVTAPRLSDQPRTLSPAGSKSVTIDPLASVDPALPTPCSPPPVPANDLVAAPTTQVDPTDLLATPVDPGDAAAEDLVHEEVAVTESCTMIQALGPPTATPGPGRGPNPRRPSDAQQPASASPSHPTTERVGIKCSTILLNADADASSSSSSSSLTERTLHSAPTAQYQPRPVGGLPEEAHVADLGEQLFTTEPDSVGVQEGNPTPETQLPDFEEETCSSPSISADSSDWSYATLPEVRPMSGGKLDFFFGSPSGHIDLN